jgi:hypothetical protein
MEVALRDDDIHKAQLREKRKLKRSTAIFAVLENAAAEGGDTKGGREAV